MNYRRGKRGWSMTLEDHSVQGRSAASASSLSRHGGIAVLHVSGGPYEMGFAHGSLLKEAVHRGPVPFFRRYLEQTLANSVARRIAGPVARGIQRQMGPRLAARIPAYTMKLIEGVCDGAGLDRDDTMMAYLMPDMFLALVSYYERLIRGQRGVPGSLVASPLFGCTSVVAGPEATASGEILHGRNFDYPGVGHWDTEALVTICEPEAGMPYVSVAAAGIPSGGATGFNAAGISLVCHQHWPDKIDLDGVPVGVAGDMALRYATNLEEAVEIIVAHPPVCAWTYILTDGDTGEGIALEVAPGWHGIVRLGETGVDGCLGYSNVFVSDELVGQEMKLNSPYWSNVEARYVRANTLLEDKRGEHDVRSIASALADVVEPTCGQRRLYGDVITSLITVASVVFEPKKRRVWVGEGDAPTSHGDFVAFDLGGVEEDVEPFTIEVLSGREVEALSAYRLAYEAWFSSHDAEAAYHHMTAAAEQLPEHPEVAYLLGLVALKTDRTDEAVRALDQARTDFGEVGRRAEAQLMYARALDVAKRRAEAKAVYKELRADEQAPQEYRAAAGRGLRLPWRRSNARGLSIDFVCGAVL